MSQSPTPWPARWVLYAIQIDPANNNQLGDYPKFAMWNDGGTQNAYFFTVNMFISPTTFIGVRAFALDRASMLAGDPANAIAFTVPLAGVGDSYSFVAATFRTGDPPPTGRDEMVLAIDSPATGGVTLTQVHARFSMLILSRRQIPLSASAPTILRTQRSQLTRSWTPSRVALALQSCRSRERPIESIPLAIKS